MKTMSHRSTIYFDSSLRRALKLKSVQTEASVSELVNEAVKESLQKDREDLEAFKTRARETAVPFEDVLKDLKKPGKI